MPESVPASVVAITVPFDGGESAQYSYVVWNVPPAIPARIDAVTMQFVYNGSGPVDDLFELVLAAKNGAVLYRQASPIFGESGAVAAGYLTWGFGGQDTAEAGFPVFSTELGDTGFVTLSLPTWVLQEQGKVILNIYRASDGGLPEIDISNVNVSYTPNGEGATLSALDILPLVVPQAAG